MLKMISWIIALFGLWEFADIIALFVPGFGKIHSYVWNHILVGGILMLAGSRAALTQKPGSARTMRWIASAAGAWLVIATFILRNPSPAAGLWNDLLVGASVLVLGVWSALAAPRTAGS
jgi:hypothetical protein